LRGQAPYEPFAVEGWRPGRAAWSISAIHVAAVNERQGHNATPLTGRRSRSSFSGRRLFVFYIRISLIGHQTARSQKPALTLNEGWNLAGNHCTLRILSVAESAKIAGSGRFLSGKIGRPKDTIGAKSF